jgi:Zn-dependent metalloprotease
MVFGDGFASADDVTAHELTHAVTQYSANLFYYMQSGALNESFSDIFGESVDLTNGQGTDTAVVRWLIGEDLPGIGAIRNMMNPLQFGDPGKVSDTQFRCTSGDDDRGGCIRTAGCLTMPMHSWLMAGHIMESRLRALV